MKTVTKPQAPLEKTLVVFRGRRVLWGRYRGLGALVVFNVLLRGLYVWRGEGGFFLVKGDGMIPDGDTYYKVAAWVRRCGIRVKYVSLCCT